jgi:hypothetical protein
MTAQIGVERVRLGQGHVDDAGRVGEARQVLQGALARLKLRERLVPQDQLRLQTLSDEVVAAAVQPGADDDPLARERRGGDGERDDRRYEDLQHDHGPVARVTRKGAGPGAGMVAGNRGRC